MITMKLETRYTKCEAATIHVLSYPQGPGEPLQTGWRLFGDCGEGFPEPIGDPTVNMEAYGEFPSPGCVFIKVTDEYEGYLESFIKAGLVELTGRVVAAKFTKVYCVEAKVLNPELLLK